MFVSSVDEDVEEFEGPSGGADRTGIFGEGVDCRRENVEEILWLVDISVETRSSCISALKNWNTFDIDRSHEKAECNTSNVRIILRHACPETKLYWA